MQQRYYEPLAGRFLSVDPVVTDVTDGSSFNRYVYGNNNPYKYTDPDGRFAFLLPLIPPAVVVVEAIAAAVVSNAGAAVIGIAGGVAIGAAITSVSSEKGPDGGQASQPKAGGGEDGKGEKSGEAGRKKEPDKEAGDKEVKGGHTKGQRPSTKDKHQEADARRKRDQERKKEMGFKY